MRLNEILQKKNANNNCYLFKNISNFCIFFFVEILRRKTQLQP